jgi:hypothetical protein
MVSDRVLNKKGRAHLIYRTSRALSLNTCPLSEPIPEFLQGKGSSADKPSDEEQVVRTEVTVPEDEAALPDLVAVEPQPSAETEKSVRTKNAVTESDLGRVRPEDTHNRTTCARARQPSSQVQFRHMDKGDPSADGFPATSILWIHHDNANGEARGTRYLVAAVDEQWHLRTLSDDERDALRQRNRTPSSCRMIQIKKSRLGRQGDLLVVERDHDFAYSVWDYTPTERREDQGQGDPEPHTMALRLVKDHVFQARAGERDDRITAKEVWEQLVGEMTGQARKAPSSKTVKRWLDRWVSNGVLVDGAPIPISGQRKPVPSYTLPSSSRALSMEECLLSVVPQEPLQEQEITMDTSSETQQDVHCSEAGELAPNNSGQQPDHESVVHCSNPVAKQDLSEQRTKDIPTGTTCARARQLEEQPEAPLQEGLLFGRSARRCPNSKLGGHPATPRRSCRCGPLCGLVQKHATPVLS